MSNQEKHQMWQLAGTFPTLRNMADEQGSQRFDGLYGVDVLLNRLRAPGCTAGEQFAILFVLDVWNPQIRDVLPQRLSRWSVVQAMMTWDNAHRRAFVAWAQSPWGA